MLRAVGLQDEDMSKPFVAVGNLASDVTPCNVHLTKLAEDVKQGLRNAGSVPFMFGTITISDGISMGTEGMKASLVSREVIADSIETVTFGESMDGLVVVAACDKNMPGAIMAMARLNLPSVFVYGGAILPGNYQGKNVNIQDVFEAVGSYTNGAMSLDDLLAPAKVHAPVCSLPTPWPPLLKRWGCPSLVQHRCRQ
jgi:dihydroxy-acid dehydratase